jgi:shikimate kinase
MTGPVLDLTRPRLLLMGMMGSGKTTVGKLIAARTGWTYSDNDEVLAEVTGETTEQLSKHGEDVLHRLEARAVFALLDRPGPYVAGMAGSTVTDPEVVRRVRAEAYGVYLRARVEPLVERVDDGSGRPWLKPDPATALRTLFAGRGPLYERTARLVLDTDDLAPEQIADRVLAALGR